MPMDVILRRKHRILVSFVLTIGLVLCLVNTLYLVHIVDHVPALQASETAENDDILSSSAQIVHEDNLTTGKERLLAVLEDAGIQNITRKEIQQLPTWNQVVQLYGKKPIITGLETCKAFQQSIPPAERLVAPAGIFNSGTNLLAELLLHNCVLKERKRKTKGNGIRWQVNWGKHQPPRFRKTHIIDSSIKNNSVILPVVMTRDPYSWMQSMCRHRYSAHWFHPPHHCPNLIPNDQDYEFLQVASIYKRPEFRKFHHDDPWLMDNVFNTANFLPNHTVVPLYVRYKLTNTTHTSLAHLWNDWYNEYIQGEFPRLVVRMEDLVFHAKSVITQVCECVGGTTTLGRRDFAYITESAKHGEIHGNDKTSLLQAMIRYGSSSKLNRTRGMTREDIEYARKVFDANLMDMFGYKHPTTK